MLHAVIFLSQVQINLRNSFFKKSEGKSDELGEVDREKGVNGSTADGEREEISQSKTTREKLAGFAFK